jgi:hypothetical protein
MKELQFVCNHIQTCVTSFNSCKGHAVSTERSEATVSDVASRLLIKAWRQNYPCSSHARNARVTTAPHCRDAHSHGAYPALGVISSINTPKNTSVQRLKVTTLPLDLPCLGLVTHSGDISITDKSHNKKELHSKRQKEPRKTFEETTGRVRPERVNKWPSSLIDTWLFSCRWVETELRLPTGLLFVRQTIYEYGVLVDWYWQGTPASNSGVPGFKSGPGSQLF